MAGITMQLQQNIHEHLELGSLAKHLRLVLLLLVIIIS